MELSKRHGAWPDVALPAASAHTHVIAFLKWIVSIMGLPQGAVKIQIVKLSTVASSREPLICERDKKKEN